MTYCAILQLENNRWFSAVLLCIYGDNHARVVPYFESCMAPCANWGSLFWEFLSELTKRISETRPGTKIPENPTPNYYTSWIKVDKNKNTRLYWNTAANIQYIPQPNVIIHKLQSLYYIFSHNSKHSTLISNRPMLKLTLISCQSLSCLVTNCLTAWLLPAWANRSASLWSPDFCATLAASLICWPVRREKIASAWPIS